MDLKNISTHELRKRFDLLNTLDDSLTPEMLSLSAEITRRDNDLTASRISVGDD